MNGAIANRQHVNLTIAGIIAGTNLDVKYNIASELRQLAQQYPQQRCGQLITNYIVPEYRSNPSIRSREILEAIFPGNPDPFFEESVDTLERIKRFLKNC